MSSWYGCRDKKVLIEIAVLYEAFPALTTMRGSRQRDPLDYVNSLKIARSLNPEYLVALHGPNPVTTGAENVRQYLTNFSDAIQFLNDQTVQYLNRGYTPGEMKDLIVVAAPSRLQSLSAGDVWLRKTGTSSTSSATTGATTPAQSEICSRSLP